MTRYSIAATLLSFLSLFLSVVYFGPLGIFCGIYLFTCYQCIYNTLVDKHVINRSL